MFGVLVVILRPDQIAIAGFSLSQRQIPLVVSFAHFERPSTPGRWHSVPHRLERAANEAAGLGWCVLMFLLGPAWLTP